MLFGLLAFFSVVLMCWIARMALDHGWGRDGFEDHELGNLPADEEGEP
jgi:hypothetical protein